MRIHQTREVNKFFRRNREANVELLKNFSPFSQFVREISTSASATLPTFETDADDVLLATL